VPREANGALLSVVNYKMLGKNQNFGKCIFHCELEGFAVLKFFF
jgi:hypothetical protein